ncbi:hypothetical protein SDC9_122755 [bioreactor metagenome]|uniref:Uncharacterized protein n=1 Tax=bioreactor metagenome TaxID=1076179 RepID=A0A645CFT4_9ZZZZ
MLAIEQHDFAAGNTTNRRLKHGMVLKVTEQVEYLVENQETGLQAELVVFVVVTVDEFNRQSCIEVFPACGWAMKKVIREISVRRLQLHLSVVLREGAVCAKA